MILKTEQQRLYALMPAQARCFVRVCDGNDALWVSDLPRRIPDCTRVEEQLLAEGFAVRLDEASRLWYVDWTMERWQKWADDLPCGIPALPQKEAYHEIYALCRLYLLHPAGWEDEHLPTLRKVLKLTESQPGQMLRGVRALHEEAAARLREKKTIAHAAGRMLAAWLCEKGKETQP